MYVNFLEIISGKVYKLIYLKLSGDGGGGQWGQQLLKNWEEHGWYNSENIASCHRTNIFGSLWCWRPFCPFFFMQMAYMHMLLLINYNFKKKINLLIHSSSIYILYIRVSNIICICTCEGEGLMFICTYCITEFKF